MKFGDFACQIWLAITAHMWRSFLAVAGIVWGAYVVFMLAALGQGLYQHNQQVLMALSQPTLYVMAGVTQRPFLGLPAGRRIIFSQTDVTRLPLSFPAIKAVSPGVHRMVGMSVLKKKYRSSVSGVSPAFARMFPTIHQGRFINQLDMQRQSRVVFLSQNARRYLFGKREAIGEKVMINRMAFTVVGYNVKASGGSISFGTSFIPSSTYFALWNRRGTMGSFFLLLRPGTVVATLKQSLKSYLAFHNHIAPKDKTAVTTWSFVGIEKTVTHLMSSVRWFLIFSGVMTLMVGGVSVANMMYFIVTERQSDIGLALALGARPTDIYRLMIGETLCLLILGGFFAYVLASFSISLLAHLPIPPWLGLPTLNAGVLIGVWALLLFTALLAGYGPARRAAAMSPVKALR